MGKLRILYITRSRLSLTRAHTINIIKTAEHLSKINFVDIAVLSAVAERETKEAILKKKNVRSSLPLDISKKSRSVITQLIRLQKTFDILYFRDPFLWYAGALCRYLLRKKIIFEVHGSHEWKGAGLFWQLSHAASHGLVYITLRLKEYYMSPKPSIIVHTNGFSPEDFTSLPDMPVLRRDLMLPADRSIVLYLGSFLWNSLEILVSSIALLPRSAVLVVVGLKDNEEKMLFELGKKMHVDGRIISRMRVVPRNVPAYLAAADVLINPLIVEYPGSISSKLYEYLAAGKPIVSSRGGANDEILRDGENALLVSEPSAKNFASALERVLGDSALSKRLSDRAKNDARQFTWEVRAQRISSFIRSLS